MGQLWWRSIVRIRSQKAKCLIWDINIYQYSRTMLPMSWETHLCEDKHVNTRWWKIHIRHTLLLKLDTITNANVHWELHCTVAIMLSQWGDSQEYSALMDGQIQHTSREPIEAYADLWRPHLIALFNLSSGISHWLSICGHGKSWVEWEDGSITIMSWTWLLQLLPLWCGSFNIGRAR